MARLAALPGRPALLYLTMFEGPEGTTYTTSDIAGRLSAKAPVYSVYSTYLDHGIVGGHMDTFEAVGAAGAELGLRILAGEEADRSEEHTSELQSLMRISYAVFCLKKKQNTNANKIKEISLNYIT